jgi:hypothetical protein
MSFTLSVIPAKAGIHEHERARPGIEGVHGSRIKSGMTGLPDLFDAAKVYAS